MRVILDECVLRPLKRHVAGHETTTVQERGWAGLKNGPLLRLMRDAGVEAFVTTDRNLDTQAALACDLGALSEEEWPLRSTVAARLLSNLAVSSRDRPTRQR